MPESQEKWIENVIADGRLDESGRLVMRSLSDVVVPPHLLVDRIYLEHLAMLRCYGGRFRFSFAERDPVELDVGQLLVIYPGNTVTLEALAPVNHMIYCTFKGEGVTDFFDSLGYFDWLMGHTQSRLEGFRVLRRLVEQASAEGAKGRAAAKAYLEDILHSELREVRASRHPLVYEAVRQIHENLRHGLVRLEPLCEALGVSRSHLHAVFAAEGLASPSDVARWVQLRYAVRLLRETKLTPSEIAEKAGFLSVSHFTTFIHKYTGVTPRELRLAGMPPPCVYSVHKKIVATHELEKETENQ